MTTPAYETIKRIAQRALRGVRTGRAGVCALALAGAGVVLAVEDLTLSVERIEGDGWRAEGLVAHWAVDPQTGPSRLTIARLSLPGLDHPLRNVRVDCPHVEVTTHAYACSRALIRLQAPSLGAQAVRASLRYERRGGALHADLRNLRIGDGSASLAFELRDGAWAARLQVNEASATQLAALAKEFGAPMPPLTVSAGALTLSARLAGRGSRVRAGDVDARVSDLTLSNESGSLATERLSLAIRASLEAFSEKTRFALETSSTRGQAYLDPIFLDFGVHAARISARGVAASWRSAVIERFTLEHDDVARVDGELELDLNQQQALRAANLELRSIRFPGAYESYLQPWLLATSFKALKTAGALSGRVRISEGAPSAAQFAFDGLTFDDAAAVFGLANLRGSLSWGAADEQEHDQQAEVGVASRLQWDGGVVLGLELGASDLEFIARGRQFRLTRPARIPVLDGALEVETFRIRGAGTPKVAFLVDAVIQPISVERLCRAFGWPEFGGRIGGAVSKLRMREGVITLGAALRAQVFDGAVSISDLRLEEPFGKWPRLYSNIGLERLDLELVTRAFSFGRITGRLSGSIRELQLFNWTPVAFDARLYTPAEDRSRRRISQRAVENIGNIGGGGAGVTAALSSGFLRFFDDFNYDQLGLSCRLANDVCHMSGVGPAPNGGYYLVKGKGLPRIDVIGNSRRVDWPRLVQQLIAITKSEGPVVQ